MNNITGEIKFLKILKKSNGGLSRIYPYTEKELTDVGNPFDDIISDTK
jgi:hypothetical protein